MFSAGFMWGLFSILDSYYTYLYIFCPLQLLLTGWRSQSVSCMPQVRLSDWTVRQMASPLLPLAGPWMGSLFQVSGHLYLYTHNSECSECTDSVFFLTAIDKDSRRTLTASGSLILNDVNFGDTAIYQCQASNKHGTILINTNIYVVGGWLFCTFLHTYSGVC